jgi:Ser/Thr protein kinase RdoA (MazF antagonist)
MPPAATHSAADTPFEGLAPDVVLGAVEQLGLVADGRLMALNSYENRVYRVGIEALVVADRHPSIQADAVVAKFYRHHRWSDLQIREEHAFALELAAAELPVAAPLRVDGQTLHRHAGFRFALFDLWRGGSPELDAVDHRAMLGRALARMHVVGARRPFSFRGGISQWRCGARARDELLARGLIPAPLDTQYEDVSAQLVQAVRQRWDRLSGIGTPASALRLHGDCHLGNILWNAQGPVFVDLDDCLSGPRVQDLWMFSAGSPVQQQREWAQLMEGYEQFSTFDFAEVQLIEPLRAMRMMNHAAWLAARWADPAFPRAFPWFGEPRYWERHIAELREQLEAVEDPPLLRAGGP